MNEPKQDPKFDQDGFLIAGESWSEQLAKEISASSGIPELTDDHWRVQNPVARTGER